MTSILKLLSIIAGIVPIILVLIKEFEKKKVILDSIGLFYDKLAENNPLPITKEKLLGLAGSFIDIAVAFFNIVGWFKHKNPISSS
jgi:hypothetical protein